MTFKDIYSARLKRGAWRMENTSPSLPEVHRSIKFPPIGGSFWRKMLAVSGPGYLVAVGYMDPGNWATDLAGGSAFGYTLLSVILISNIMAIVLQALAAKLGIVTGRDLAQACRDHFSKPVAIALWILCELAIIACDIAEVIGSAIALNLLFGIPLLWGVCITALDVFLILFLQNKGFRYIEAFVLALIIIVAACLFAVVLFAQPEIAAVLKGFIPHAEILLRPEMLFIAIGILGATVMPHNIYLHSSIVQTRDYGKDDAAKKEAIKFATIDSTVALMFALFINAAILIISAATFYVRGQNEVAEIQQAYTLLSPLLGVGAASTLFAVALLASGQNSTLTATLAGQVIMEGFLKLSIVPWLRRIITRLLAIIPVIFVAWIYGESGTTNLLILSQVILSMQLPFAVIPLIMFTSEKEKMGVFVNGWKLKISAWIIATIIVVLNVKLLVDFFGISAYVSSLLG